MKYPNGKTHVASSTTSASAAHRGMSLEDDINTTNDYYLKNDIAVIYKKPTPITIVHVDYPNRQAAKIDEAYFTVPSTTDYNGIYKGKYIDFEAKECQSATAIPFAIIHPHQITHLENVIRHGSVSFLIFRMSHYGEDYVLDAKKFLEFYKTADRKSIPYSWLKENAKLLKYSYIRPCDYLSVIDIEDK